MKDFLEYMQSLNSWQNWGRTKPVQQFLHTLSTFSAQANAGRSPFEIMDYAKSHELLSHPWLIDFENTQFSQEVLNVWLKQRYLVSWCFPNWLTGVMAKLPSSDTRIPILMNLYEEHGLVEGSAHHSKPHPQMWRQLFEEFGVIQPGEPVPLPQSEADILWGTQLYLQIYTEACFKYPTPIGLGVMTFTECILPFENVHVLKGLERLEVSPKGQEFFAVHCECDEAHANEIIEVIELVATDADSRRQVWQGVEMAAMARKAFYDNLLYLARNQVSSPFSALMPAQAVS